MRMEDFAKALGRRGGQARARRLAAEDRKRIAAIGGQARARSLRAARRIDENFRYVEAASELRGAPSGVVRLDSFGGRLPGIYPGDRKEHRPSGLHRRGR